MFNKIVEIALKSLLYEVAATPKPGLVDRGGNGAHIDMDFFKFIDSSVLMRIYFEEIGQTVKALYKDAFHQLLEPTFVFDNIKPLGIKAEKVMLQATDGVNTHKGAIYSLGLLVSAANEIELTVGIENLTQENIIPALTQRVQAYILPNLFNEFKLGESYKNYGVKQFVELGLLGARGEAASGFYHANIIGLPEFENCINMGMSMNDAMVHALLRIITVLEDSNVIGRRDQKILSISQKKANQVLEVGGLQTVEGKSLLSSYCQWCINENISHGGSADMLVVTMFLYFLKNNF
ncbi:triphosphoribosyl-dephospho-CoA synthase [Fusibacter bizertensis]